MKDQDQEKFVTVSVSGSVDAVAEAISRIFGATVNPDALEATDADGNIPSKFAKFVEALKKMCIADDYVSEAEAGVE